MTMFIYSNAFAANMILSSIEYVFNIDIECVVLLKENHSIHNYYSNSNISVQRLEKIEDCIASADIVLIVRNNFTPMKNIHFIKDLSIQNDKIVYEIIDPWDTTLFNTELDTENCNNYKQTPVILCLYLGDKSGEYFTEMKINEMFTTNGINICHIFTKRTRDLLIQLDNCKLLNDRISLQLTGKREDVPLIVYSKILRRDLDELGLQLVKLSTMLPDYIILQTEFDINNLEQVKNTIVYTLNKKVGQQIKSRYLFVNNEYLLHCEQAIDNSSDTHDMYSQVLYDKLRNSIFTQLAYPEGIIVI